MGLCPCSAAKQAAPPYSPFACEQKGEEEKKDCTWDYPHDHKAWVKCCDSPPGSEQSPIDLPESIDKLSLAFKFELKYSSVPIKFSEEGLPINLVNNGKTIKMNVAVGQTLTLDSGEVYDLLQFHFHTHSEHTVNDKTYPLEMHLVHKLQNGDELLVLGIFFDKLDVSGNSDDFLGSFWDHLPGPGCGTRNDDVHVSLSSLASAIAGSSFYNYGGSLTTPPLTEGVTWIVAKEPLKCTDGQIRHFRQRSGHDGNFRPPQPLGKRVIRRAEIVLC